MPVVGIHRSLWYYQSGKDDGAIIARLNALANEHPTRGFDKYYGIIRNEGLAWGRRRVLRVYRALNLKVRRKHKRRLPARIKEPLQRQEQANKSYSMDFMSDSLATGRKLRVLNVMDDCTRQSLAAWCDYAIPGEKVVDILKSIVTERGKPDQIRVDNGPEFRSKLFCDWCRTEGIKIKYIQPGRPMQNAYIERLNRTFREDVLDAYLFETLEEVRILSDEWQDNYNNKYPHTSLHGKTPKAVFERLPARSFFSPTIEKIQSVGETKEIKSNLPLS